MMMDGYELIHNNKLATVFSAPNYCFRSGNKGGVMEVDTDLSYKFIQFNHAPHRGGDKTVRVKPDYFL